MEKVAFRGWIRRKSGRALRRLRSILEDDEGRGARAHDRRALRPVRGLMFPAA